MEDALFNDKMEEVIQSLANMSENSNELNGLIEAMGDNISSSTDSTNTSISKAAKAIKNMAMNLDTMNSAIDRIDNNISVLADQATAVHEQLDDISSSIINQAIGIYMRLEDIVDQLIVKNMLTIQSMYPATDEELCKKVYINNLMLGYDACNTVNEMRQRLKEKANEEDPKS